MHTTWLTKFSNAAGSDAWKTGMSLDQGREAAIGREMQSGKNRVSGASRDLSMATSLQRWRIGLIHGKASAIGPGGKDADIVMVSNSCFLEALGH